MQARASAIEELTASGALEDYTAQGDDIDRQLAQLTQGNQVDDELAKLKAELGKGDAPKELPGGAAPPADAGTEAQAEPEQAS
jgi:phage shock protein A